MNEVLKKMAKGITVCYSEVFPNRDDEYFHLGYMGKLFIIADSYCMNPECSCQEAALNFVQALPRKGNKTESFMIMYKLNGRGYKILDQGNFNKREIQGIMMHFTADGTKIKLLNERLKEMKEEVKEILGCHTSGVSK